MIPLSLPLPERAETGVRVDYGPVLDRLAESTFRRRKRLLGTELEQLRARGVTEMGLHARRFVADRLAPAQPANDGRQTPYRGHPVFIAQHATATCCRTCLEIWHRIPKGRELTDAESGYVAGLIEAWLRREIGLESIALESEAPATTTRVSRRPPRARSRRRSEVLRLVVEDGGGDAEEAAVTRDILLLEEREADGTLLRRWLQLELFAPAGARLPDG